MSQPPTSDLNAFAWCHRCNQHRIGEPAPFPEICQPLPTEAGTGSGSKAPGYQDSLGKALRKDPWGGRPLSLSLTWDTSPQYPSRGKFKVPGAKRRRRSGPSRTRAGSSGAWTDDEHEELTKWEPMADLDPDRLVLDKVRRVRQFQEEEMSVRQARVEALLSVPGALHPGRRRPLPPCAVRLLRDSYGWEAFIRACRDGVPVAEAGRMALSLAKSESYDLRKRIEEAGSPAALFQRTAIDWFRENSIPWGHQVEDGGWSRAFFIRLIGGPAAAAELRNHCPNENHLRAVIRQREQAGDMATVQFLLFASHSGLWR